MRSPHEIYFRLRQEVDNLRLFAFPPNPQGLSWTPQLLPPRDTIAATLRGSAFASEVERLADGVLSGTVSMLGSDFTVGRRPAWRKDYVSGIESGTAFFRKLPYLDASQVGDHKIIWELNRHQQLALLAMAALLTGRDTYSDECARQLSSWLDDNSFLRGINWTSALEVAFRALSWIWILSWIGDRLPELLRRRLTTELYRHGVYLQGNLSVYFSPNTHLLGEAVVLHLLGRVFPDWPRSRAWESYGSRIAEEQMDFQIQEDGVHFEQSTYYHVYAVDFFLLHRIFARKVSQGYDARLRLAISYLRSILGARWEIPLIGDDDGGRLFHPYGDRPQFGRATMATASMLLGEPSWLRDAEDLHKQCVWWLGPQPAVTPDGEPFPSPLKSEIFRSSGMAVLTSGDIQVTFDAGPFGWAGAGHSHSDTLSLTVSVGEEEVLIDAGTYTYVGEPRWRDWFRGSAAHNTIRVDGKDQAQPLGPFRWADKPEVAVELWDSNPERDVVAATCRYRGVTHRRRVLFDKDGRRVVIEDEIDGDTTAEREIEQFWHFGAPVTQAGPRIWKVGSQATLTGSDALRPDLSSDGDHGWRSRVLGRKEPAPVLRLHCMQGLPFRVQTVLSFSTP